VVAAEAEEAIPPPLAVRGAAVTVLDPPPGIPNTSWVEEEEWEEEEGEEWEGRAPCQCRAVTSPTLRAREVGVVVLPTATTTAYLSSSNAVVVGVGAGRASRREVVGWCAVLRIRPRAWQLKFMV